MLPKRQPREKTDLEKATDELTNALRNEFEGSDEYKELLKRLEKLHALKEAEAPKKLDPNTALLVGGNILAVVIIVGYERMNVIGSKAMNFINPKPR